MSLEVRIAKEPVLILSTLAKSTEGLTGTNAAQEWIYNRLVDRYDILKAQGYKVKVLGNIVNHSGKFVEFTSRFLKQRPDSMILLAPVVCPQHAMLWPRDTMQIYKDILITQQNYANISHQILEQLNMQTKNIVKVNSGYLNKGGHVIRHGDTLICFEEVKKDQNLTLLKKRGYQIHFLPSIYEDSNYNHQKELKHIDLTCNIALTKDSNLLFLVGESYHSNFPDAVNNLAKKLEAKLFIVPSGTEESAYYATNYITLPDGKVMLPNNCRRTQEFLETNLGKENVLIAKVSPLISYSGPDGGLRCMSNLIE